MLKTQLLTAVVLAGLASNQAAAEPFTPTITVTVDGWPNPVVHGTTNLPDGTVYTSGVRGIVHGGHFSEPLRHDGMCPLIPDHDYYVSVYVLNMLGQPLNVDKILGPLLENTDGPFVHVDGLGTSIVYEKWFHVGPGGDHASTPLEILNTQTNNKARFQQWKATGLRCPPG